MGFSSSALSCRALFRAVTVLGIVFAGDRSGLAGPTRQEPTAVPLGAELDVTPDTARLADNPALRARLIASPHGYFRFINIPFMNAVCRRVRAESNTLPTVTLHGDAHVEQYAVTELGRGLTDFDDSASGPATLDLARFGVSIRLAAHQRGWMARAEPLFGAFLRGYRKALTDPLAVAPEPAWARRVQSGFDSDRLAGLARAEALMDTLPAHRELLDETSKAMALEMLTKNSQLPRSFFNLKKTGILRAGIGSALAAKYLVRVEGPGPEAEDDVILEVKELQDLQGVSCLRITPGPSRIMVGQARIAYEPFQLPGVLRYGGRTFWIHAWPLNYRELDIAKGPTTPQEFEEVAYDAGVQLGRGHPNESLKSEAAHLRKTLLKRLSEDRLQKMVAELADETIAAWERFRVALQAPLGESAAK
jgi:Uncharacterized protein conserved in bacteria (DUF2252)